ncbi:MAG: hypothetical protein ACK5KT_14005 [Dysgonomonas sp.]
MALYNFKEKYYNINNINVEENYTSRFYAYMGAVNPDGSRLNPRSATNISATNVYSEAVILAGGRYKSNISLNKNNGVYSYVIGQGIDYTRINGTLSPVGNSNSGTGSYTQYTDMSFDDIVLNSSTVWASYGLNQFYNCQFYSFPAYSNNRYTSHSFSNNIFHFIPTSPMTNVTGRNTMIGGTGSMLNLTAQLYHKCKISLTSSNISGYAGLYTAFNDCLFKIGEETEYKVLNGTSPSELRDDFVARCQSQGITPNEITEYGETLAQGRWIFTKNSVFENKPYKNSDIYQYEIKRNLVLGFYSDRFEAITISPNKDEPNTFISDYGSNGLTFNDRSLIFDESIDITNKQSFKATSKIIWLGSKRELHKSYVPNTFLKEYGVLMDSTPNLEIGGILPNANTLEADELYFVRSTDKNFASILYNGSTYDTNISSTTNRFRAINGVNSFSALSGNPIVYKLKDILQYYTLQMRIVNVIPNNIITSGNLSNGYWYLVEHDNDQYNSTDYITYKGINYKAKDSFLVKDTLTFSKTGNIHLRRCWKDEFNYDTEIIDKAFWTNEQKPKWFDVIPDDLRCLKKGNSILTEEMQIDESGEYISSGNPNFYHMLKGSFGYPLPAFNISGVYIQFQLHINTQSLVNII